MTPHEFICSSQELLKDNTRAAASPGAFQEKAAAIIEVWNSRKALALAKDESYKSFIQKLVEVEYDELLIHLTQFYLKSTHDSSLQESEKLLLRQAALDLCTEIEQIKTARYMNKQFAFNCSAQLRYSFAQLTLPLKTVPQTLPAVVPSPASNATIQKQDTKATPELKLNGFTITNPNNVPECAELQALRENYAQAISKDKFNKAAEMCWRILQLSDLDTAIAQSAVQAMKKLESHTAHALFYQVILNKTNIPKAIDYFIRAELRRDCSAEQKILNSKNITSVKQLEKSPSGTFFDELYLPHSFATAIVKEAADANNALASFALSLHAFNWASIFPKSKADCYAQAFERYMKGKKLNSGKIPESCGALKGLELTAGKVFLQEGLRKESKWIEKSQKKVKPTSSDPLVMTCVKFDFTGLKAENLTLPSGSKVNAVSFQEAEKKAKEKSAKQNHIKELFNNAEIALHEAVSQGHDGAFFSLAYLQMIQWVKEPKINLLQEAINNYIVALEKSTKKDFPAEDRPLIVAHLENILLEGVYNDEVPLTYLARQKIITALSKYEKNSPIVKALAKKTYKGSPYHQRSLINGKKTLEPFIYEALFLADSNQLPAAIEKLKLKSDTDLTAPKIACFLHDNFRAITFDSVQNETELKHMIEYTEILPDGPQKILARSELYQKVSDAKKPNTNLVIRMEMNDLLADATLTDLNTIATEFKKLLKRSEDNARKNPELIPFHCSDSFFALLDHYCRQSNDYELFYYTASNALDNFNSCSSEIQKQGICSILKQLKPAIKLYPKSNLFKPTPHLQSFVAKLDKTRAQLRRRGLDNEKPYTELLDSVKKLFSTPQENEQILSSFAGLFQN